MCLFVKRELRRYSSLFYNNNCSMLSVIIIIITVCMLGWHAVFVNITVYYLSLLTDDAEDLLPLKFPLL